MGTLVLSKWLAFINLIVDFHHQARGHARHNKKVKLFYEIE